MLATKSTTSVVTTSLLRCTLPPKSPGKNKQPSNKQKGSNSEGHGRHLGGKAGSSQETMVNSGCQILRGANPAHSASKKYRHPI